MQRNAEAILHNLAPDARAALEAYAKGVNAYLANRKGPLPPEFLLTGAPAPAPWQPVDSIGWQTMMAWDLGANWTQELLRMRLAQRLPLERINQFLPPYPGDAPLPTQDYTELYRQLAGTTAATGKSRGDRAAVVCRRHGFEQLGGGRAPAPKAASRCWRTIRIWACRRRRSGISPICRRPA